MLYKSPQFRKPMLTSEQEEQAGLVLVIATDYIVPIFLEKSFSKTIFHKFKELTYVMSYFY